MACSIIIEQPVLGTGNPLDNIVVKGTANECAPDPIKNISSVRVRISCPLNEGFQEQIAEVDAEGRWAVIFQNTGRCSCGSKITVEAVCVNDENCRAEPVSFEIKCIKCPVVDFFDGNDDVPNPQQVECDYLTGTILVSIHFNVTNPSANDIGVKVNCGPGGTQVSGGLFIVPAGGNLFIDTVVCRYDPVVTPSANPFIEFCDPVDESTLGCDVVKIDVPVFPECEEGCANTIELEVKNSDGVVIDPDGVQCLIPGDYIVKVISPPTNADMGYFWQIGITQQTGENLQEFEVFVGAETTQKISAIVTMPDCVPLTDSVSLIGCTINCNQELIIQVKKSNGEVVNPSNCLENGDYIVTVTSPTGGNWKYQWVIDGNVDNDTNAPVHTFTVIPNETISISVTAEAPGCADKTGDISLSSCSDGGGGGGGGNGGGGIFSCDGLLIAAISSLIIAGIALIIGICAGESITTGIGIGAGFTGAILLGLWFWLCTKKTSCSVLNKIRCLLSWLILFAFAVSVISTLGGAFPCGLAAAVTGVSWGVISNLLTDVMVKRKCGIVSCILW